MVTCTATTRRVRGVTLVHCRLASETPRRVRVRNRLDGPVWPPRRRGVPAEGWDDAGVTVTVDGETGVGYACPAPPRDPAVDVTDAPTESGSTAETVVRSLSDPSPPPDAIGHETPGPERGGGESDPVESWLAAVERRVARVEALAAADDLQTATAAVDTVGGLPEVERLVERVAADREALAVVADRAAALRDRAGAADPDTDRLRRLA